MVGIGIVGRSLIDIQQDQHYFGIIRIVHGRRMRRIHHITACGRIGVFSSKCEISTRSRLLHLRRSRVAVVIAFVRLDRRDESHHFAARTRHFGSRFYVGQRRQQNACQDCNDRDHYQ